MYLRNSSTDLYLFEIPVSIPAVFISPTNMYTVHNLVLAITQMARKRLHNLNFTSF